jgi:hypothetical protein
VRVRPCIQDAILDVVGVYLLCRHTLPQPLLNRLTILLSLRNSTPRLRLILRQRLLRRPMPLILHRFRHFFRLSLPLFLLYRWFLLFLKQLFQQVFFL